MRRTRAAVTRAGLTIRAWVADGPGADLAPEPLSLDEIRPGEVLVRVAAVGVCHTDIAYTDGSRPAAPFPLVAGHEGAGVITAAGPGAEGFAAGDRVVMSFSSCGRCRGCLRGRPSRCSAFRELNSGFGGPGGHGRLTRRSGEPVAAGFFGQSSFADHAITGSGTWSASPTTCRCPWPRPSAAASRPAPAPCSPPCGWARRLAARDRHGSSRAERDHGGADRRGPRRSSRSTR